MDYFRIFNIPSSMWVTSSSLHMEGNAAKWMQLYKRQKGLDKLAKFIAAAILKFVANDNRDAVATLLDLKQEIQWKITMHNSGVDELLFVSQFVKRLKEDICSVVQGEVPKSLD